MYFIRDTWVIDYNSNSVCLIVIRSVTIYTYHLQLMPKYIHQVLTTSTTICYKYIQRHHERPLPIKSPQLHTRTRGTRQSEILYARVSPAIDCRLYWFLYDFHGLTTNFPYRKTYIIVKIHFGKTKRTYIAGGCCVEAIVSPCYIFPIKNPTFWHVTKPNRSRHRVYKKLFKNQSIYFIFKDFLYYNQIMNNLY